MLTSRRGTSTPPAIKARVRAFWEASPLMTGELALDPTSREFFEAHEAIYRSDVFIGGGFPQWFFPFPACSEVLDIGCGPGLWTRELARRGFRVSAVDLTEAAVDMTQRSLTVFSLDGDVRQGDAEDLPFPDGRFDGIVSHGVIPHTPDTQECLHEMARVLRPGGVAVVSVYYRNLILRSRILCRVASFLLRSTISLPGRGREGLLRSGDPDEIVRLYDGAENPLGKAYTAGEFDSMVKVAGLEIERQARFYLPLRAFGQLGRFMSPLHPALARRFGLMYVVTARKPR